MKILFHTVHMELKFSYIFAYTTFYTVMEHSKIMKTIYVPYGKRILDEYVWIYNPFWLCNFTHFSKTFCPYGTNIFQNFNFSHFHLYGHSVLAFRQHRMQFYMKWAPISLVRYFTRRCPCSGMQRCKIAFTSSPYDFFDRMESVFCK